MPQTVRGVISRVQDQPVELVDITLPDPGPRDVVVDVQACGVCHTDHNYVTGANGEGFPFLLGHEAAGVVSEVGDAVTHVAPGDFVILNWRAVCGECRACRKGQPWYCFDTFNASKAMTLADGTELTPALGIGAFADKTLVHELQCTKVDPKASPEVAGLLGCGVMAGIGAALNTGQVQRGESVAVIGCGGVGDAAIVGALLGGATTVIALDRSDAKLAKAAEFGATATLNTAGLSTDEVVEQVQALTGGFGPDLVIDAVGIPATYEQAFRMRDLAGRVVLVGVPDPNAQITLPMGEVFGRGGALKSSWYGDCLPERDFPYLVDLYLQDRLPLEEFVSETCGLGDVEQAFEKMAEGSVLRSVVVL